MLHLEEYHRDHKVSDLVESWKILSRLRVASIDNDLQDTPIHAHESPHSFDSIRWFELVKKIDPWVLFSW